MVGLRSLQGRNLRGFRQLFGEQDEDESELDQAAAQGENGTNPAQLRSPRALADGSDSRGDR